MNSSTRENLQNAGLLWLRVLTGAGMAYHGYGKVFGDMSKMIEGVTSMGFPLPIAFAWAAALSEFVGGICLIIGLGTPIAAFLIFMTMNVAIFMVHKADPLQVKELAYAYWTISITLMLTGAGKWSLDRTLLKKN